MNKKKKKNLEIFDYYFFKTRRIVLDFILAIYWKTKRYFYNGNFSKKHLTFGVVDGKIQITSTSHNDYIAAAQKRINKLSKLKKRKKFIKLALTEAMNGGNFIIFSILGEDNKYVQFWTGEHQLKYDFYANEINKLKNFFLSTVGLLSEMGFVNDEVTTYSGRMIYKVDKGTDYISLKANFRKDIDLASEFTEIIFKQLYKIGRKKLVARIE